MRVSTRLYSIALAVVTALAFAAQAIQPAYAAVSYDSATTWYVSLTGSDTSDCATPSTPCLTINAAIGKATDSDTIKVAQGVYTHGSASSYAIEANKSLTILGGWSADFSQQNSFTTLDNAGISATGNLATVFVSIDHFIVKNNTLGSAVYSVVNLSISNSSIHHNSLGAVRSFGPSLSLNNVTISHNAYSGSEGGGILTGKATVTLNNVTIAENYAYVGGGIYYSPSYGQPGSVLSLHMANSILWNNSTQTSAQECNGPIISDGHNILGTIGECIFTSAVGDAINTYPQMGSFLTEQGYYPLALGSPAIDAGAGCYGSTDQRYAPRVGACDIGAYEYTTPGAPSILTVIGGSNQSAAPNHFFQKFLEAAVLDAIGSPVSGVSVTFTAPSGSVPSLIFSGTGTNTETVVTDVGGVASATGVSANQWPGAYSVQASALGGALNTSFNLENRVWYVSNSGSDTNSCNLPDEACATINAAIAKALSGDFIYIAQGTYTDSLNATVINIDKDLSLEGGWDAAFHNQSGYSVIDGENTHRVVYINPYTVSMRRLVIQNGLAGRGAGITNNGNLEIERVFIINNHSTGDGGAIHNMGTYGMGTLTLTNSVVAFNIAEASGGGIYSSSFQPVTINNSTISTNTASSGGGIYGYVSPLITLNNVTISNNLARGNGGGIAIESNSIITMYNSILAGNSAQVNGVDCADNGLVGSYNIIGNATNCTFVPGSIGNKIADPKLGGFLPLQGYHPLLAGSPAIDAGSNCYGTTDQRGHARVGTCDIGAYEYTLPGAAVAVVPTTLGIPRAPQNTTFALPLQAAVLDAAGTPVGGKSVVFTAPASGPSGNFANGTRTTSAVTSSSGVATSTAFTANNILGAFSVDISSPGIAAHSEIPLEVFSWFVSNDGDDANDCETPLTPCKTINEAIARSRDNDVIYVATGRYTKQVGGLSSIFVDINKSLTIVGGWSADFSQQNGQTILDGERRVVITNSGKNTRLVNFIITNAFLGVGNGSGANLTLERVGVINNVGQGVDNYEGNLFILNSTISGNQTGLINSLGNIYINNSTIAYNTTTDPTEYGGGIRNMSGNVTLTNSIVSNNSAPTAPDCYNYEYGGGSIVSSGHNIIGNTTGCVITPQSGDMFNLSPKLTPLLPLGYHALAPSSPAITGGNSATCLSKDQRGADRLSDAKCDIGAYEYKTPGAATGIVGIRTWIRRTPINAAFTDKFIVAAVDGYGSPVSGVTVHMGAPASGPSGTFSNTRINTTTVITDENGIATSTVFTANKEYGEYNVTADVSGISSNVIFAVHNGAWFISPGGDNANNCLLPTSPCASIPNIVQRNEYNAGETIWAAEGVYNSGCYDSAGINHSVYIVGGWNDTFDAPSNSATDFKDRCDIRNGATVNMRNIIFENGLWNEGQLYIEKSTFRNSDPNYVGHSLYNSPYGILYLVNVTVTQVFSGNNSLIENEGGIMYILSSTITNNKSNSVAGIENWSGTVYLANTIIAGNTAMLSSPHTSIDCNGAIVSLGHNIIGTIGTLNVVTHNYACRSNWLSSDHVGKDFEPILASDVVESVPTQQPYFGQWIHIPLPHGLAIDGGSPLAPGSIDLSACPISDQRGMIRPQGARCDIGSYEYGGEPGLFFDVPTNYWAWKYIESIYNASITGGCSTSPLKYCPDVVVTRAQMAVFLGRGIHGSSFIPPAATGTVFLDIPSNHWAATWIEQFSLDGITGGCGSGNYCPDSPVTRDQMAVFLLRAKYGASYTPPDVGASTGFNDVPVDYWAAAWIKQLAAEGITGGCSNGDYCPAMAVTRAQMAVFLQRTFNLPMP